MLTWRQQLARRLAGEPAGSSAIFTRVDVVVAQRQEMAALVADVPSTALTTDTAVPVIAAPRAEGLIGIMLPSGASVRVDAQVDGRAWRRRRTANATRVGLAATQMRC
jgi:predicted kinase